MSDSCLRAFSVVVNPEVKTVVTLQGFSPEQKITLEDGRTLELVRLEASTDEEKTYIFNSGFYQLDGGEERRFYMHNERLQPNPDNLSDGDLTSLHHLCWLAKKAYSAEMQYRVHQAKIDAGDAPKITFE